MNAAFWTILLTYAAVYALNVVWLSPEKRSAKALAGVAAWSVVSSCLSYAAWCGILVAFRHLSHVTVDADTLESIFQIGSVGGTVFLGWYLVAVVMPRLQEDTMREIEHERRKMEELDRHWEQQRQEYAQRMEEILLRTGRKTPDS
jgi:hypothetical protein